MPVAMFVHGGGSVVGWSGVYTNTSLLSQQGIIYVTVQYRLAALGFLPVPEAGIRGNFAVLDLIAALQWIQKHIAAFGGDPGRVMIFGQSSGAWMVEALLLSPLARDLFHAAALHSSAFFDDLPSKGVPAADFFTSLGCFLPNVTMQLACARERSWQLVLDSVPFGSYNRLHLDGSVLPLQPQQAMISGSYNRVPVILGYNLQENSIGDFFSGKPFDYFSSLYAEEPNVRNAVIQQALSPPCCGQNKTKGFEQTVELYAPWDPTGYTLVNSASADSNNGVQTLLVASHLQVHSPVFVYAFAAPSSSPALRPFGAMHLLDLMFVLNDTFLFDDHTMDATELALAKHMSSMWANFAATGVPGHDWPLFGAASGEVAGSNGAGHWFVIGQSSSIAVSEFRPKQLAFFCKWQGVQCGIRRRAQLRQTSTLFE